MAYVGSKNFTELYDKAKFIKITDASLVENHPHDISITRESPIYSQK